MFRTLSSKLVITYTAIAMLSLFLALAVTLGLARDYIIQTGFDVLRQKESLAIPYIRVVVANQRAQSTPRLLANVRTAIRSSGLRVLIVDPDTMSIKEDTSFPGLSDSTVGSQFPLKDKDSLATLQQLLSAAGVQDNFQLPGEKIRFQYIAQRVGLASGRNQGQNNAGGLLTPPAPDIVVLAQPEPRLAGLVSGELGVLVLLAVLVGLVVSLLMGYVLARLISRPMARLAAAAKAMAHGDYTPRLPVHGNDEFATLTAQFNEMAEQVGRANQMQRDFIANVSHDLKTPLTSIQGFSQAMLDGTIEDREGYVQAASIINTEAQRMSRLVNQLLNLSQLQNGLASLDMQPLEAGALLSKLTLAMQPQAQEAGVTLACRVPTSRLWIMGDEDRLKQAFGNLIDNALKHTPPGGDVTVHIKPGQAGVEVSIADTGPGIPPGDLPRVMERFYQVEKSRTQGEGRSIGLGLAIAREIIFAHRGQISIESAPGQGTVIRVLLPSTGVPSQADGSGNTPAKTTRDAGQPPPSQPPARTTAPLPDETSAQQAARR